MSLFFNILALLLVTVVGGVHAYAIEHSLYWLYLYFDVIPHTLGGLTVGAWVAGGAARLSWTPARTGVVAVCAALVVGVAWEVFEFVMGLTSLEAGLFFDTSIDLLCAVVGALLILVLYIPLYRRYRRV